MKRLNTGSVNASIAILAIGTGLILGMRPWHVYHNQQDETAKAVAQMKAAEKAKTELLDQEAQARSALGRERMARGLGFIKKGEVPAN